MPHLREGHDIVYIMALYIYFYSVLANGICVLEKDIFFLIYTKVPYGLVVALLVIESMLGGFCRHSGKI